jgi:hypothetical protein
MVGWNILAMENWLISIVDISKAQPLIIPSLQQQSYMKFIKNKKRGGRRKGIRSLCPAYKNNDSTS